MTATSLRAQTFARTALPFVLLLTACVARTTAQEAGRDPAPGPVAQRPAPSPGSGASPVESTAVSAPAPSVPAQGELDGSGESDAGPCSGLAHSLAAPCGTPPNGMSCVPGGWFLRGHSADAHDCDQAGNRTDGRPNARPEACVWIDTFYIDQREVTNERYQACVASGACQEAGPNYADFDRDDLPITGVRWYDARDFCVARGGHLPTESEWEAAARGPAGDLYPWGDAPTTCELAIVRDERGRSCGVPKPSGTPETGIVQPPCSRPPGRYELCDMMGNAEEWVADWYAPDWDACGADCLGDNPRGPCGGIEPCDGHRQRVVRGGSWYWPAEHATGYHRRRHIPSNEYFHHFGFRCAATPEEAGATPSEGSGTQAP